MASRHLYTRTGEPPQTVNRRAQRCTDVRDWSPICILLNLPAPQGVVKKEDTYGTSAVR